MVKPFKHSACLLTIGAALLLHPASGSAAEPPLTTVAAFDGTDDGAIPVGTPLYHANLISGATYGGTNGEPTSPADFGTLYAVPDVAASDGIFTYAFSGPDGAHPNGGLVADAQGNLYGTTNAGGTFGFGTIFKLTPGALSEGQPPGQLTVLHNFTGGTDGANPTAGVTLGPDGSLYGATPIGGAKTATCPSGGCGTWFKLSPGGSFQIVYGFTGDKNGYGPLTGLAVDPQGVVLGSVTLTAGVLQAGVKISGTSQLVAVSPGSAPRSVATVAGSMYGDLVRDPGGNVYGLGSANGSQNPAIWKVTAQTHVLSMLATLPDVGIAGGLTRDAAGNLYATTPGGSRLNGGLVLAVSPGGAITTLATLGFTNQGPRGGVTLDPAGIVWGTSSAGAYDCHSPSNLTPTGCGTLFAIGTPGIR